MKRARNFKVTAVFPQTESNEKLETGEAFTLVSIVTVSLQLLELVAVSFTPYTPDEGNSNNGFCMPLTVPSPAKSQFQLVRLPVDWS